jgi:hypothetical protein
MDLYPLIALLLVGGIVMYGIYITVVTVTDKVFEKQRWDLRNRNSDIALPLRLQAYERMALFLERITPGNLLLRLGNVVPSAKELQVLMLHEIREEYNHNVAQQIYMSHEAWEQVVAAMNQISADVNAAAETLTVDSPASELARKILANVIEMDTQPTARALKFLKTEVQTLFK